MKSLAEAMAMLRYSMRCKAARNGLIAVLMVAMFCLSILSVWWGPSKRAQTQLLRKIDVARTEVVEAERTAQVANAQRAALAAIASIEKKLEVRASQADLIQGVASLALRRGVRVVSQSFDEGRTQRDNAPLYLELGLLGDYFSLRRLMDDFATLPMWIEIVEARAELAGNGGELVRAQLRLVTYRGAKGPQ